MGSSSVEPKPSVVEKLNLKWTLRLLNSSIGRKFVMGITGLGLCGFLVAHLAGNLLLYVGGDKFDHYAHTLHQQEWLPLAEAALFAMFLVHIYLAFVTTIENRRARKQAYLIKESKIAGRVLNPPPSNWMFISGTIVLGFLILHIIDMKLGLRPDVQYGEEGEAYKNTVAVLSNPISRVVYALGTLVLGLHLAHGFSSAFQSLGLSHPKYTPAIKAAGIVFAIVISAGFFSLPVVIPNLTTVTAAQGQQTPAAGAHPVDQTIKH